MASPPLVYVLNGPNLNLLGLREPEIYGSDTLDDIAGRLEDRAKALGLAIDMRQSNHEGHLIDWLHEAQAAGAKAVLLNAGGYTHTSVALHDAVKAVNVPVIEVHLSNPQARESYRRRSLIAAAAKGTIAGFGALGYELALDAAARLGQGEAAKRGDVRMSEETGAEEPMRVDTELVKKLAEMLDENGLSEIEVEDNGRRIVVKRKLGFAPVAAPAHAAAPAPSPPSPAPAPAVEASPASHPGAVKSPMVGTVFLAAEPGAAPFITAGARVEEGDTLLIIEAMKVMNPIAAPRAGVVKQILVQDAQPVEYEQPLAIIE